MIRFIKFGLLKMQISIKFWWSKGIGNMFQKINDSEKIEQATIIGDV